MFPDFPIDSITNGVHAARGRRRPFQALFDRRIPEWRTDNLYLRYAVGIPLERDSRRARGSEEGVHRRGRARARGVALDPNVFTIGFARRATPYKRADLMFTDLERLARDRGEGRPDPDRLRRQGASARRRRQGAHSAHPPARRPTLQGRVTVVYSRTTRWRSPAMMVAGVDLWLNNPMKPLEASRHERHEGGAERRAEPLSVLDGWWIEGHVEGVTGWSIGGPSPTATSRRTRRTCISSSSA